MENIHNPGRGREKLEHTKKDLSHLGFKAYDDVLSFNSQAGSQWDGFRKFCDTASSSILWAKLYYLGHAAHQATGLCYNGLAHADIADPSHDHQIGIDRTYELLALKSSQLTERQRLDQTRWNRS
jgi:hypothetical protein